ncbi:hypothetical protein LPJ70_005686 [Coemansia sp. RSA 2708]|nr:hypothetical protein LPJ70_005686 [Coemansia sp. RSA 2708]
MGLFRNVYLRWKALRLPWRSDVYVGSDLEGNLYFERIVRGACRSRRHVVYRKNLAVSDYSDKVIPVQWQAWMRHTRAQAPTVAELIQDIRRQERIAVNVRQLAANEARAAGSIAGSAQAAPPNPAAPNPAVPQPRHQKSAPGEGFQPARWEPAAPGSGRGRHTPT